MNNSWEGPPPQSEPWGRAPQSGRPSDPWTSVQHGGQHSDPWGQSGQHPDPWGPAPQGRQSSDPWEQTEIGPAAQPWGGLPPSMTPPSLMPTVLVTVLAGLFGLIPASTHAARARSIGLPGRRYWKAFGITLAIMSALWIGVIVVLYSLLAPPEPEPSPDPTPVPTVSPTTMPSPATTPPRPTYSPPPRTITTLPAGSWITVLDSLEKDRRTEADAWAMANGLSRPTADVVVVDSDAIPGLNPGYWAIAVIGSTSRAEATDSCAVLGRPVGGSCYPREVG